jgi:hypothetical protein
MWTAAAVVALVVVVLVITIALVNRKDHNAAQAATQPPVPTAVPAQPIRTAAGRQTVAPWPAPTVATVTVHKAGLPMLGSEGSTEHIHAHLDLFVDGQPVTVPALIGIDETAQALSPLHTHNPDGIIHIESPVASTFSLGQFFTEWDVALDANRMGGYAVGNGNTLRAFVNGKPVSGNPAAITLNAHDEIAIVYGPAGQQVTVPSSFTWAQGL